jgi:hypothetical protein
VELKSETNHLHIIVLFPLLRCLHCFGVGKEATAIFFFPSENVTTVPETSVLNG